MRNPGSGPLSPSREGGPGHSADGALATAPSRGRDDGRVAHPYWPLFDLAVVTSRLALRYVDDELAVQLVRVAENGVHDPDWMPFTVPWTDLRPPVLQREMLRYWWHTRSETTVEAWHLDLAVLVDGVAVGVTTLDGKDFPVSRTFQTGSWLGRRFQGQGIGTEMRAASLHLGFAGLGADVATTAAFRDNAASLGVTRRLGYQSDGTRLELRRGVQAEQLAFRMTRESWERQRRDDIELHGIDRVRDLLNV